MRDVSHAREHPLSGDVLSLREHFDEGDGFDAETILRVLAVAEDHVWFKEYGKGRLTLHVKQWRNRVEKAQVAILIRGHETPF